MTRTQLVPLAALGLVVGLASPTLAINWNDIAVGTDTGISGGSVFTLKGDTLAPAIDPQGGGVNPRTGLGAIADVGFQTNGTAQPPNTPPGTIAGGPLAPLETVVWLTAAGDAGNANANRPGDKLLNSIATNFFSGTDLTVLGDDTVFLGGGGQTDSDILASGLQSSNVTATPVVDGFVIDSVWQKLPSDNVAILYTGAGDFLGVRDGDGAVVGTDLALPLTPIDVDVYRQDPTLVVAINGRISVHDGLTLAELDTAFVGSTTGPIVAISVLSDDSVAVALSDGVSSEIQVLDSQLDFVASSGILGYGITAMDNQNVIDTLVVGNSVGEVRILDSTTFNELAFTDLGDGAITAITVNAPEPTAALLAAIAMTALAAGRRNA